MTRTTCWAEKTGGLGRSEGIIYVTLEPPSKQGRGLRHHLSPMTNGVLAYLRRRFSSPSPPVTNNPQNVPADVHSLHPNADKHKRHFLCDQLLLPLILSSFL